MLCCRMSRGHELSRCCLFGRSSSPAVPGPSASDAGHHLPVSGGIPWWDLLESLGPWQTVWKRDQRFCGVMTWDEILARLQGETEPAGLIEWEVSMNSTVHSTVNRAHQHAMNLPRHTGGYVELQELSARASCLCNRRVSRGCDHEDPPVVWCETASSGGDHCARSGW